MNVRRILAIGVVFLAGCSASTLGFSETDIGDTDFLDEDTEPALMGLGPCARVVDCATEAGQAVTPLIELYGDEGTCWDEFPTAACWADCRALLNANDCEANEACCECTSNADCEYSNEALICDEGACVPEGEAPVTGDDFPPTEYFMLLHLIVAEDTPLQLSGTVERADGQLQFDLEFLSLDVLSTDSPREPTGTHLTVANVPISDANEFEFTVSDLAVTGSANPITGSDIVMTINVEGSITDTQICGSMGGQITVPANIDLTGSYMAGIVLPDGPLPDIANVTCD